MDENQSLKGVLMTIAKDNDLNYENNDSEIIEKIKEKYINENNENKNKKIYKNENEKEKHKNIYLLKIMTIYVFFSYSNKFNWYFSTYTTNGNFIWIILVCL